MTSRSSRKGIVDPRPALEAEYRAEVERRRVTFEVEHGLVARWRWWRARRRIYDEMVTQPLRSARW